MVLTILNCFDCFFFQFFQTFLLKYFNALKRPLNRQFTTFFTTSWKFFFLICLLQMKFSFTREKLKPGDEKKTVRKIQQKTKFLCVFSIKFIHKYLFWNNFYSMLIYFATVHTTTIVNMLHMLIIDFSLKIYYIIKTIQF